MTPKQKAALSQFANLVHLIESIIDRYSDQELADLKDACEAVNQTNCWWATYNAAKMVLPVVNAEILLRERSKAELPS